MPTNAEIQAYYAKLAGDTTNDAPSINLTPSTNLNILQAKQQKLQQAVAEKQQKLTQNDLNRIYQKGMEQRFEALVLLNTQNVDLISRTMNPDGTGNIFGEDKPLGLHVERAVRGDYGYFGRPLSDTRGIGGKSIYQTFNNPQDDSDYYSKYPEGKIPTNFKPAILDKVIDMDTLKFRGVTGGKGGINNITGKQYDLTGKPTGDRQVGVDAFEVPHEGNDAYINSASGQRKLARQLNVLNAQNSGQPLQGGTGAPSTAVTEEEILKDLDAYDANNTSHDPWTAVTGIGGALAGGVLSVASSISASPKELYNFLGGDYLEDNSTYSKAVKTIINTMDKGAKYIDKFNNDYVDTDKKSQNAVMEDIGKAFDKGNYITGVFGAVEHNPIGAIELGASNYAFGKAMIAKGITKIPAFMGSVMGNTNDAEKEFEHVNHRPPNNEERGIMAVLSTVETAVDTKANEVVFNGVKGDKFLEGLSKIVDKGIDILPSPVLKKLLVKPLVHEVGRMTAEGIQEGPIQQGLQHIAAYQNNLKDINNKGVLRDIYVNGIAGNAPAIPLT